MAIPLHLCRPPSSLYYFFTIIPLTLSKAAMSKGMSHFVLVIYSNAPASLIFLPTAFFFTRGPNAWMLSPDIELISTALFGNLVTFSMQVWCIRCKGLVFVATFKPLSIFVATLYIVAFLGFIFLGDDGEEGIGGKRGEGRGVEVCKNVKGLVIREGMVEKRERDGKWHFR
ncbi:hypothetical protein J1N35_001845 [Gossypium stocksii]|uniref:WAT1-related protein n=1 Tax=Gossypium stocksii TaxID=47602 RepID=A0A9D3WII6_9ROSI|nr:hypothetical protein J1N35_001845 [Gossypium stocksii]